MYHKAVLLNEAVEALGIGECKDGVFVDATLGGGGHTRKILEQLGEKGRLIVFDKDEDAKENVPEDKRVTFVRNNFRFVRNYVELFSFLGDKPLKINGLLADLGVSSHQFDTAERGFSYRYDSQLDMRMNVKGKTTAADVVNTYSKQDLERVLREWGEIGYARAVAEEIVKVQGDINTTGDLCNALKRFYATGQEKKFLGKVFQALRIEVNREMEALEDLLEGCKTILAPGAKAVFITYHSLEDRMVKNSFRDGCKEGIYKLVNKKPILPTEEELTQNGRSRSAKMRIAQKI